MNYLYRLCHKNKEKHRQAWFRLYDIEKIIEKDQDNCNLLSSVQVGCQGQINFSLSNQRLVFLSSFEDI